MKIISTKDNQAKISGDFDSVYIGDLTKEEWTEGRSKYIGGSESFALVSRLIGYDYKWDSPYTLFCKKVLGINLRKINADMLRGIEREDQIRQELRELNHEIYTVPYLFFDREFSYLAANIDGIEKENEDVFGIEIKSVNSLIDWEKGVPKYYWNQCQHYMMILGTKKHRIIADCNKVKKIIDIDRDEEHIKLLKESCINFWNNHVVTQNPPELMYIEAEKNYVDHLYKDTEEGFLDLAEQENLAKEYLEMKEKEKEIKESLYALSLKMKTLIGRYQGAMFGNIKASYIKVEKESFDLERFKQENPELFDAYTKKTFFTQLRVK